MISGMSVALSNNNGYVVDGTGRKVSLPRGSSDAALAPYHVERSKLFVLDRVAAVEELDGARIARAIGFTRFPYSSTAEESAQLGEMAEHPPFYLPSRSGPCDNIFKRKKPSAAVK